LFALGHQIFMAWVTESPESDPAGLQNEAAKVAHVAAKT